MTLSVNRVVQVEISVAALALQRAGFGIMNLVGISDVIPISERLREYNDLDGVSADFDTDTEEYKAATIYFSQSPRPDTLYISRRAATALTAELIGGSNTEQTIATWTAISDGAFDIDVDGATENVTTCDFSSVTDMDDVADVIATQFSGTCTWDSKNTRFVLRTASTGSTATISFASSPAAGTDISGLMDALSTDGGTANDGVDAEDIQTSLNAIEAVNSKWYGFSFTSEVRDDSQTSAGEKADALDAAAWAEARIKTFWNNTSDANTLVSGNTSNISYQLEAAGYSRTATAYNAEDYPAISLMARGATVDFDGTDTTIDYAFKQLPGITATDLSASQASALEAVNCNYYANFGTATSGDSVAIVFPGDMASGRAIDEIIGIDWLQNAIQTDVFNYLYQSTTKIPQTDEGVAGITQNVSAVCSQAVTNGLAAPGYITIGSDTRYLAEGYEVEAGLVEDQSSADREAREAPPVTFVIKGAGAIRNVTISGTFVR